MGGGDDDIVVAGTTAYDQDLPALASVMREWTSDADYWLRIRHLFGYAGDGPQNAGVLLLPSDVTGDSTADTVSGDGGTDFWFVAISGTKDKLADYGAGEVRAVTT